MQKWRPTSRSSRLHPAWLTPASLQDRQIVRLRVTRASCGLRLLLSGGETASSGEHHQSVPRHAPELEGKRPVEDHDEHAVDPLKDGRGVLQRKALLAKEDSTW